MFIYEIFYILYIVYMRNETKIKVDKIHRQINKIALKGKGYILEYKELVDDIISKGNFVELELCLSINYGISANRYKYIHDLKNESWSIITQKTNAPLIERIRIMYKQKKVFQIGQEVRTDDSNYAGLSWSAPLDSSYSVVATASQVNFSKGSNNVVMEILDGFIYRFEINKASWNDGQPYVINSLQVVDSGTYSNLQDASYSTPIPLDSGDYLLTTYRRPGPVYSDVFPSEYSVLRYRVTVSGSILLGEIKEVDSVPYNSKYYYLNSKFAELTGIKKTFLEVTKVGESTITIVYDNDKKSEETNLYQRYVLAIDYLLS